MKFCNYIKILLVFLFLITSNSLAQECKAKVTITTDLDSSSVFVNNKYEGKGSVKLELAKGFYRIKAVEPSYIWNAKTLTDSVIINDCSKEKKVNLNFFSSLYLKTSPENAYVYSADSLVGYTPLFISDKYDSVELKMPDYELKRVKLDPSRQNQTFNMNYIGAPVKQIFFKTPLFKILMGSLVVLGAATAYFKLKADDKFSQYQATGSRDLLNQTRRFDLISGITMGALQINLGFIIYYFLTD